MQINMPALDRKLRRRANRTQRQLGAAPLNLGALQQKAEADVRLRCKLSEAVLIGVPGAAKAKRKLSDTWTNRNAKSLAGFWNPQA